MLIDIDNMKKILTPVRLLFSFTLCLASCGGNSKSEVNIPTEYCEELVKLAEEGNAEAQNKLGYCYDVGQGVEQSASEAVKWYQKAAEQDNADAQANLGSCYHEGKGVPQSDAEAFKWFEKSAKQGNAVGQNNLGLCYDNGIGVEQSYKEAVKWYKKAAEQGLARSQYLLGSCYLKGEGVEQSDSEGEKWLEKAANQGLADAQAALGDICYSHGMYDDAMGRYCQAALQGHKAGQEAMNTWIKDLAYQGNADAQCAIGLYMENRGFMDEAIGWFNLAAKGGNHVAAEKLKKLNKL